MSVKLSTIKNTLGESGNTLSALCKSGNINKWSRHKPYAVKKYAPLEDSDIAGVFFGLEVPIVEMNNISPATQTTTWKRLGPSSIFRLSDFDGYVHTAESPFKSLDGVTNLEFQKNKYYSFSLNIRTNQTSGSILVGEFKPHNTLHTFDVPLSDCYLGIALYRNNNASEWSNNKSSICQWAYCSSKTIGKNSIVSIPSVTFDEVKLVDYSSRFYLVFFLTPTAFTSFTKAPSSDSALTTKMAVLEGGIYPVKITSKVEEFPILWEGNDSDYYTIGIYNNSVSVSIINLETPNEIDSFINAEVSIDKTGGRFSLNPTSDMENLAYYANSSITERRVRFSIFGIEGWIGNYIPKFTESDLAGNCEFYPIIQYYDVDGNPVYFGIVYEYKGSSTLDSTQTVSTYTWERHIAFFDGSSFYGTTQIDTISYSVDDSGHTTETSITPITKVLIQQNMNVSTGDWTGIQVEVYQDTVVTETAINTSHLVIPTDVYNGAVTFGIDTQYERWYNGTKAYNPITNRVGTFNLQLRIQDRL
jgi:hypothetical protein